MALKRIVTEQQKRAWTVREFCDAVSISRATAYRLMDAGSIRFVMIGRARRVVTSPESFIRALVDA